MDKNGHTAALGLVTEKSQISCKFILSLELSMRRTIMLIDLESGNRIDGQDLTKLVSTETIG